MPPLRFLYAFTVPATALVFYTSHLRDLQRRGHRVHLVSDPEPPGVVREVVRRSGVTFHAVPMRREIRLRADLASLAAMVRTVRRVRPDVLNFTTPKGALLAGLAGAVHRVPLRVYNMMGLRSETARRTPLAPLRPLLLAMEWLTCACAHEVICISPSNRDEAIALGLVRPGKIRVLGSGSAAGIPVERYARPDPAAVQALRGRLNLPEGTPVVGFVGRLVLQKGLTELLEAWPLVHACFPQARLLLVGELDPANPLPAAVRRALDTGRGIVRLDAEADMSRVYPLMSVFTLPSLHEGLGMVLLEASAAGVPTVVTDGAGVRDTNLPGITGLQVPAGDVPALALALQRLLADPAWARRLGQQGQAWVQATFNEQIMNDHWATFYEEAWARRQRARRARPGSPTPLTWGQHSPPGGQQGPPREVV
ncbi:glycosyltransferase family 4 protein [Deinococcus sp. SDU3-2]|uniref:Glycosyltransferase family 4 protein n=1 Tax=Deinococcus terrestris TaxID=2651870 RepID=A0A7X1TSB2_9DEIO|nr:glycosyltransferase [Deinococcus terrestris]MPY67630.1 glycosyltransferase family 4 protein [Deinococcus terrestris]